MHQRAGRLQPGAADELGRPSARGAQRGRSAGVGRRQLRQLADHRRLRDRAQIGAVQKGDVVGAHISLDQKRIVERDDLDQFLAGARQRADGGAVDAVDDAAHGGVQACARGAALQRRKRRFQRRKFCRGGGQIGERGAAEAAALRGDPVVDLVERRLQPGERGARPHLAPAPFRLGAAQRQEGGGGLHPALDQRLHHVALFGEHGEGFPGGLPVHQPFLVFLPPLQALAFENVDLGPQLGLPAPIERRLGAHHIRRAGHQIGAEGKIDPVDFRLQTLDPGHQAKGALLLLIELAVEQGAVKLHQQVAHFDDLSFAHMQRLQHARLGRLDHLHRGRGHDAPVGAGDVVDLGAGGPDHRNKQKGEDGEQQDRAAQRRAPAHLARQPVEIVVTRHPCPLRPAAWRATGSTCRHRPRRARPRSRSPGPRGRAGWCGG